MIYFIKNLETGHIKIGTSKNPWKRLFALQTANSSRLHLMGITHGGEKREERLKKHFAKFHFRGEWFYGEPELVRFIRRRTFLLNHPREGKEVMLTLRLIAIAKRYGSQGFVVRDDPQRAAWFKRIAQRIFEEGGNRGMHRVYDNVIHWSRRNLDRRETNMIAAQLDWRFNGVGGWWA